MKYCVNCEMNLGNVELIEKDDHTTLCPKCEHEIIEIKQNRLIELINEISHSFHSIKAENVQNNAQALIYHAKKIEIGEKKLKKEFLKREKQMKELQYEIDVILKISEKLGYEWGE